MEKKMQFNRRISITVIPVIGGEGLVFNDFRINFEVQKRKWKKLNINNFFL